jgi:hypothetical protein
MAICCGVGGLVGAHYFDLFCTSPAGQSQRRPVAPGQSGLSSYGGLIGTLGFFVFALWNRVKRLRYADAALVGVVLLLTFSRAGCASVHDHVGAAAVARPPLSPEPLSRRAPPRLRFACSHSARATCLARAAWLDRWRRRARLRRPALFLDFLLPTQRSALPRPHAGAVERLRPSPLRSCCSDGSATAGAARATSTRRPARTARLVPHGCRPPATAT